MSPLVQKLMVISALLAKRSEILLAFVVIGVVFMMIMPLPTGLVDTLIALNISISTLLVIIVMYLPGPVAFSTFPGILLITTLFRLALSITTTRLILLYADAGEIVEAFGNFVVGGNLVVGIVIFLILMIVNFLVITKGSERIAEVSARFTLDAMPGKQMSIDSDLRAGLLSSTDAQSRRKALAKESQLFGAMDGAMKFVKGDAIAGIIIVMVNILGGVSIGVTQLGMSSSEALELYAILTIGDGLVAQIPALLISLTAGLMITRVQDEAVADSNVGQEMAGQITGEPKAWLIAAGVLIAFALVPGMPTFAFLSLSLIFGGMGGVNMFLTKKKLALVHEMNQRQFAQRQAPPEEEDVRSFSVYERVSVSLHEKHKDSEWFTSLRKSIRRARNEIVLEYAYMLPVYKFIFEKEMPEDEFILRFYEAPVVRATIGEDKVWVPVAYEQQLQSLGIEYQKGLEDRSEDQLLSVSKADEQKLSDNDITFESQIDSVVTRSRKAFLRHCHMFIGLEESHKIMSWAMTNIPELAKECERILPLSRLTDVLRKLASESISLKSLHKIFETLVTHGASERDSEVLTETVRMYLRDQICSHIARDNYLDIFLLEPELEEHLRDALHKTATGGYFSIDDEDGDKLISQIESQLNERKQEKRPLAMVVSQDLRPYFRDFLKNIFFDLPVLSYAEISESVSVKPIARLSM